MHANRGSGRGARPTFFADGPREEGKGGEGGVLPRGPRTAFTGFAAFPPPAHEKRLWVGVSFTKGALLAPAKTS